MMAADIPEQPFASDRELGYFIFYVIFLFTFCIKIRAREENEHSHCFVVDPYHEAMKEVCG